MTLPNLWKNLTPRTPTLTQLKKDYERGITPDLPYFIVGQDDVKEKVGQYLSEVNGEYFNRSLIFSDYGNGKTNLLKYLELYFEDELKNENIHYIYQRANVDKPDIFLNLLKLIEDKLVKTILESLAELDTNFIKREAEKHSNISQYINKITTTPTEELILMGTGRFYTKNYYSKNSIPPLTDFDRREVFIFFMNVLAQKGQYVIFALDELEIIYEKSKMRFRTFLTSYRELIDKSHDIKGHFLLTAIVSSSANINSLLLENPAFYSRIKEDMIEVGFLTTANNKKELITNISQLLKTGLTEPQIEELANTLKRDYGKGVLDRSNRFLLADINNAIRKTQNKQSFMLLDDILEKVELEDEFEEMYQELEDSEVFSKIQNRFFDPLQYYLEYKGYDVSTKNLFKKSNLFYPSKSNKVYSFILDNSINIEEEIGKLKNLLIDNELVTVFTPESIDIKYEDFDSENINIINYEPKKLLTLFVMIEEIGYYDDIQEIVKHYTKGEL